MSARQRVQQLVESRRFQQAIMAVIVVNAVTLGAETSPALLARYGDALHVLDRIVLAIFVAELAAKLFVYRLRFFRDPWNCFDFLIVGISLVPTAGAFSVLRALRVLRVLRLISIVPSMRRVVSTLLAAVPGVASIVGLLLLVTYVAAVMATKLFGEITPQYFGNLGRSLWTLFQVMTGEAWPDIAAEVMAERPMAWIFFLIYILISTFVVLNLFLAVVVGAMESVRENEAHDAARAATGAGDQVRPGDSIAAPPAEPAGPARLADPAEVEAAALAGSAAVDSTVLAELAALRQEVRALRELLTATTADRS